MSQLVDKDIKIVFYNYISYVQKGRGKDEHLRKCVNNKVKLLEMKITMS